MDLPHSPIAESKYSFRKHLNEFREWSETPDFPWLLREMHTGWEGADAR